MSQAASNRLVSRFSWRWLGWALLAIALVVAVAFYPQWSPHQKLWTYLPSLAAPPAKPADDEHAGHGHEGHDHGHEHGADQGNSLKMSEQARKNIGLVIEKVALRPFTRTLAVPGIVVERPGRSVVEVTAPMTGVVTALYALEGVALEPGQKLFDMRLTDEDLVRSQAELLRTVENLDVVAREIARIEKLASDGGLPAKTLLERKYEQQKEEAVLRSQRQALLLHGMSGEQIDVIVKGRTLLQTVTIVAPQPNAGGQPMPTGSILQVAELKVAQGQHVTAGDALVMLANHAELFIEGEAFERDIREISQAADSGAPVTALLEAEGKGSEAVENLKVLYLAGKVNPDTRTLDFFVTLPNEIVRDVTLPDGSRFVAWRFRPGQRVQLHVPVETLPDRIVLPAGAVAQDGVETYVFTPSGGNLVRRPVHVEYRDPRWVVIAHDGSLFPGESVAVTSAQQLQIALKNKAGGGIDPHAGHNH